MLRVFSFGLIERYIFKMLAVAFAACLGVLTLVIWISSALRQLDLITSKGQAVLVFLSITTLTMPSLITVISPAALVIAVIFTLNRLSGDSELIVMNAAGMRPATLLKPLLLLGLLVGLLIGAMTVYALPASFRAIRDIVTKVRADLVGKVVQEGQFTAVAPGITFHYRDKAGDTLQGVFLQDRRDRERAIVYIAERGRTIEIDGSNYLILEKGSIQRQQPNSRDSSIVVFERYEVDLKELTGASTQIFYRPRERTTAALLFPDKSEPQYKALRNQFRAELHERFSAPLYAPAFILTVLACIGAARTTREDRNKSIALAVGLIVLERIISFAISANTAKSELAILMAYLFPLLVCAGALGIILLGVDLRTIGARLRERFKRSTAARPA